MGIGFLNNDDGLIHGFMQKNKTDIKVMAESEKLSYERCNELKRKGTI